MSAIAAKKAITRIDVAGVAVPVGEVRSFSIETTLGTIDVSTLSTTWKNFLVGQSGWSGTMELLYDPADAAQEDLVSKAREGTLCTLTVQPLGAGAGNTELVGTAYITSMGVSGATEEAVGLSISFKGTGELELNANAS